MISGFAIGVVTTLVSILILFLVHRFSAVARENRAELLEQMHENYSRLQAAVSEMLARADEADQESKYLEKVPTDLSRRLSKACSELVALGDKVRSIESRFSRKDPNGAGRDILRSLGKANQLSTEIKQIRSEIAKEIQKERQNQ